MTSTPDDRVLRATALRRHASTQQVEGDHAPEATAWLLGGAVAVALLGIVFATRALPPDAFPASFAQHIAPALGLAAVACLAVSAIRPERVVLTLSITVALFAACAWRFVVDLARGGTLRLDEPPHHGEHPRDRA